MVAEFLSEKLAQRFGYERAGQILARRAEMLTRFGTAAHRFARSGFVATPPEILAEREATCRACPEWDPSALNNTGRCRKCGCSTWAKLRMATETCPLGKWKAVEKPESGNLKPESSPASASRFQVSGLQSQPSSSEALTGSPS
jgi:hypothetical protein